VEVLLSGLGKTPFRIRKTYILLPAYNEAPSLARLIPRITQQLSTAGRSFEVIVVNDGSSDNSSQTLHAMPPTNHVRELRHEINRGYGAALRTAFLWVAQNASSEDAAVSLDADNTHDPAYIPAMLQKLEEGFIGVTASYTMPGGHAIGVPWMRRMMSFWINAWFRSSVGLPGIDTYTNGFRAYRASAIWAVQQKYQEHLIDETGFPGGVEFFLKVAGLKQPLTEIPFDLHYEQRGDQSKIRLGETIRKYLHLLSKGKAYAR